MAPPSGRGVGGQTGNNGRIYIALKPWDERVGGTAQHYIARLRPKFAAVAGGAAFLQAAQDIRVGGRLTKTEFQYTLQDADFDELFSWAPKVLDEAADAADAARRHQRPADRRHHRSR